MNTFTAGPATFIKLKEMVGEMCRTAGEMNVVRVVFMAENLPIREIRRTKDMIILLGYPDEFGEYRAVPISDGDEFVLRFEMQPRDDAREIIKFTDFGG